MIVTIETKARSCPGVVRAISLAEDVLRRGGILISAGQLIHNRREVNRLRSLGLRQIKPEALSDPSKRNEFSDAWFIVRAHGESKGILQKAQDCNLRIVDATCPIVSRSQELVDKYVREGWRIVIVGSKTHPEVIGLMARTNGYGTVVSSRKEVKIQDFENRTFLLAQTTVDPYLFSEIRRVLSEKLTELKIADTMCRFLRTRQNDILSFAAEQDAIIIVGGKNSSNCKLLYKTAYEVNKCSYLIEDSKEVDASWFRNGDKIGISGGASTPRWQLEEMKSYLNNYQIENSPKGFKNRKGGKVLWRMWKNQNKVE
jgi:4-hydroxy-3-methylbut-2-enyl diphosphate reductase